MIASLTDQKELTLSSYQPTGAERDLIERVKKDVTTGDENLNTPFDEFNGVSMLTRMDEDQRNWLNWNPGPSNDPEEDWRWTGTRPIIRNKIISTAAHLTRNLIAPAIFAQNDQDEEDKTAAYIMGDLLEYNIRRSDYEQTFLYGVISGLVNPVSYIEVKYCKAYQHVWVDDHKEEVLDDENSGFRYSLTRPEEILFANPYQFHLQKQGFVARRRRISYEEAESVHGSHDNWEHVKPGVMSVFSEETTLFYDVEDDEGDDMVEEVVWMRRGEDIQVPFVNGVYLGNPNTEYNPFYHRTPKNKPKYPWTKYGAEPIDNMKFFAYKSLAAKMANDQELVDRQWQLSMDASFLATLNPTITIGAGKVDKSVYVPATVTDLPKDAQVVPLNNNYNPQAAFQALREAERSISESSHDPQIAGQGDNIPGTARQSILLQQNAETNIGLLARMIGVMVKDVGSLMVDDIIRYQTVGEMMDLVGEVPRMKYMTFIVDNKVQNGTTKSHVIKFSDDLHGKYMTEDEHDAEVMKMKTQGGDDRELSLVNPRLFARLDFLISVDYEKMLSKNTAFERAFKLETYDRAINNPLIQQNAESLNAITRDFLLEPLVRGDASKYLPEVVKGLVPPAQGSAPPTGGMTNRITESGAMEAMGRELPV